MGATLQGMDPTAPVTVQRAAAILQGMSGSTTAAFNPQHGVIKGLNLKTKDIIATLLREVDDDLVRNKGETDQAIAKFQEDTSAASHAQYLRNSDVAANIRDVYVAIKAQIALAQVLEDKLRTCTTGC